jgi:ribonuclease HII
LARAARRGSTTGGCARKALSIGRDPRYEAGVAAGLRERRLSRERSRRLRRERELWRAGVVLVAGVDEVGMGPLAGPVVAAAVVLPQNVRINGVRDSKLLSGIARERLAAQIADVSLGLGIGVADVLEIDRLNIYHAGLRAMARAVAALPEPPGHLLIDARKLPECPIEQTSIVDGDALVYSIAAASIVAKVYRDRMMRDLAERYPGYGFDQHVGYATRSHLAALRSLGPCPAHRRSFARIRDMLGD